MSYQQFLEAIPPGFEYLRQLIEAARVEITAEVAAEAAARNAAIAADVQSGKTITPNALVVPPDEMTVSGAAPATSFLKLNHASVAIAATITPTEGLLLIVSQKDAGTAGHTLTTAGTFDGTNNTATFNAAGETLVLFGVSSTLWVILQNIGSVGLSAVP